MAKRQDKNPKRIGLKQLVETALNIGPLDWQDTDHYGGSSLAKLPGGYYVSVIVEIGTAKRHWVILDNCFTQEMTIEEYKEAVHSQSCENS